MDKQDRKNLSIECYKEEFENQGFKKYAKESIEHFIGKELLENCKSIDFDSFAGKGKFNVEVIVDAIIPPEEAYRKRRIVATLRTNRVIEYQTVIVTRKEEVDVSSKWYKGQKLTWKERLQALFKGELNGVSHKLIRREKWN